MAASPKTNQPHFGRPMLNRRKHQQDVAAYMKKGNSLKERCRGYMVGVAKDLIRVHYSVQPMNADTRGVALS